MRKQLDVHRDKDPIIYEIQCKSCKHLQKIIRYTDIGGQSALWFNAITRRYHSFRTFECDDCGTRNEIPWKVVEVTFKRNLTDKAKKLGAILSIFLGLGVISICLIPQTRPEKMLIGERGDTASPMVMIVLLLLMGISMVVMGIVRLIRGYPLKQEKLVIAFSIVPGTSLVVAMVLVLKVKPISAGIVFAVLFLVYLNITNELLERYAGTPLFDNPFPVRRALLGYNYLEEELSEKKPDAKTWE